MQSAKLRHSVIFLALLALAFATQVQAQTYTDLFDLDGTSHGCWRINPAAVAQGRDGNVYGTTISGGANGRGNIFKSTPTGTITVLHDFNTTDGSSPQGGLTLGADGNFYGSTTFGGSHSAGTLFKVTASGTFTTIYNFTNGADAGFPHVSPIFGSDGKLYGTASVGGTNGGGVVYKLTLAGVYTVLHNFDNVNRVNGFTPTTGVVEGSDGFLYGVASVGGANLGGTIFQVKTDGTGFA